MDAQDKAQALKELRALNISRVEISFSGGNDEGSADGYELFDLNGTAIGTDSVSAELLETLEAPVYDTFGGFDGPTDVAGTLTWDVAEGTVQMDHAATEWVDQPSINF